MSFIKLNEQIVNSDLILSIQQPRELRQGWGIYATINNRTETGELETVAFNYKTEQEAKGEYDRIVAQLCANR